MTPTVAFQGAAGAFADEACAAFTPDHGRVALPTFAAVAEAVRVGKVDCGILPIRNIIAGPVPGVADLIADNELAVAERFELPVRLHLLARPGTTLEKLARATSHPVALAQCAGTLRTLCLEAVPAANTAVAAREVANSEDRTTAAVASEAAARIYGLSILRRDVHDRPDNVTTFALVTRTREARS